MSPLCKKPIGYGLVDGCAYPTPSKSKPNLSSKDGVSFSISKARVICLLNKKMLL